MNFFRNLFGKVPKENASEPSERHFQEAKRIFFEYSCNHYHMSREGINFKKYHISQEQENIWRNEFLTHWKSKLSTDDLEAVHRLEAAYAIEAIPDLLAIAEKGDSYAKLWIAHAIWSVSFRNGTDASVRNQARATAMTILRSIIEGRVQLSEHHRREIPSIGLKNLGASTP